jgi:peptidoglycan hydrolase-like protein with peptidoglycan-binding domain
VLSNEETGDWGEPAATPSPTPAVTAAAGNVIREGSPSGEVRNVQRKLIALGLMPAGSADGKYGAATATAAIATNNLQNVIVFMVTTPLSSYPRL